MKLFSVDGGLYKFMSGLTDIFVLSICWLICSLPVITIGASTTALFSVTLKMAVNEEGYVARQFFKAFKSNLKQGIVLGIITLAALYALYIDFQIITVASDPSIMLIIMSIVSAFVFLFSLIYAYPLTARYENTIPRILKNSFRISMKFIGRTVFLLFVLAVELIFINWNLVTLFVGAIVGPGVISLTISSIAKEIFNILEKEEKSK